MLVAREQVEGGAHMLDVCTALTERTDEDRADGDVVKKLAQSIEAPLMIDSTEAARDRGGAEDLRRPRGRQLDQPRERPRSSTR